MRRLTAAVIVILATVVAFSLPPAREPLAITSAIPAGARGAIHIHTQRSDGSGTIDDVAAAAARAGLKFVVLTDRGDGTRQTEPPAYRQGVLVIDAVEVSTSDGHLIALGIGRSPFPLGGDGRDAVEDIARLGGVSLVAHPASPESDSKWVGWDAPFDGLEWLSGDTEWRHEPRLELLRSALTYPLRPSESLGRMLDRPDGLIRRWDELAKRRRVVAVAAADVSARLPLRRTPNPYFGSAALHVPSYQRVFETFSIVIPQLRLTQDALSDARLVIDEIRSGHVFSSIDALATPAAVSFTAGSGAQRASGGDVLPIEGPVTVRVASNAPAGSTISLFKDGEVVATSTQAALDYAAPMTPAVYRAEIGLHHAGGDPPIPWIVSNPIYVGRSEPPPALPARAPANTFTAIYDNGSADGWRIEATPQSAGAIDVARAEGGGTQLRWRYALGGARDQDPAVALIAPAGAPLSNYDRVMFSVRADKPMRVALRMHVPDGAANDAWQRTFYVDNSPREVTVFFDDLRPRGASSSPRPALANIQSVMWVIAGPHTALGSSGQVWLDNVRYAR